MNNYKIILDEVQLDKFIEFLPELEEDEVYYLSLFGRHKYAPNEVPNMRDNQLSKFIARKSEIKEKILRLECPIGSFKRNGEDIPQHAIALYISLNPRNLPKANRNLLVELTKRFSVGQLNFSPISLAISEVHRATGRKFFVSFDYDGISYEDYLQKITEIIPKNSFRIIRTRGGFHLIVNLKEAIGNNWYQKLTKLEGCDVKGTNNLIPVPGCIQGGFVPIFI